MGKTQKYTDDQLLEAVIRYAEHYKGKIMLSKLAEWTAKNMEGMEEIKSYMFSRAGVVTDANGNTWIVGYSFANDFVCDYPSFMKQTVSTVTIQASTECEVYLLPLSKLNQFWETDMDTQRLGRQIAETMFAEIYQRLLGFYCDTPEQRYHALMKRCPGLQEKLSFKEIAQFLGITPETLSRIRKKQLYNERS